ncbi:hypothetical protein [Mangrovactinospora gilvigrisea]|uniref:hypothetical protein n=1 Tax=Mangrovactinospora gilvigrisea TaxID=1428644 RepID=UPI001114DC8E|nr:hypothetical protein [Mangrovactinospora gilvigrisea]
MAAAVGLVVAVLPTIELARQHGSVLVVVIGGFCAVLAGLVLGIRVSRAAVYSTDGSVVIRNYLWTRRVPIRDVLGVEAGRLYWCGRRGRLRRSRITAVSVPIGNRYSFASDGPGGRRATDMQQQLHSWIDQVIGAQIKGRARRAAHLDDAELAREARVAAAGVHWEHRRRRFAHKPPRPRWGILTTATECEVTARSGQPKNAH